MRAAPSRLPPARLCFVVGCCWMMANKESATMLDKPAPAVEETNSDIAGRWVLAFDAALRARSDKALGECFVEDSHWRNLFGISWYFATFSGREVLVRELLARARDAAAAGFRIDAALLAPRRAVVAGREVIEAVIRFDTANGPGFGAIRLLPSPDGEAKAWTISTTLDYDRICAARDGERSISHVRDFAEADWLERRRERAAYSDCDPDVLVVGGGHTGISAAVEVKRMASSALIVDREERIGDNWRLRYRGLKLHNKTPVNHLRYVPFPVTFPEYIPKDQIANWLENYVDILDVDFWTRTSFEGAAYDGATGRWTVRLNREGAERVLHPKHIVIATSVSGFPNIPVIHGIDN